MICYACGDFVRDESTDALERMGNVQVEYFNPAEMLVEVSTGESREKLRSKVEIKCAFTIQVRSRSGIVKKEHRALTKDVSKAGICIYSKAPLKVGQIVNFEKCPALRGRKEAEVYWVKKAKDYFYISGLKFSK